MESQKTISKERYTAMSHPRMVRRAGLASFLTHLCAALVHRDAFFGRNFGAVFEHAKTLIREEHYTAMSHPGMVPRAGLASFLRHVCAALVDGVAFPGSVRRAIRVRRKKLKSEILASFLMHLCAALIDRVAFFWTKFRSGF